MLIVVFVSVFYAFMLCVSLVFVFPSYKTFLYLIRHSNDAQYGNIQHNDTQHDCRKWDTQHWNSQNLVPLS
jgi:hypothetical protein